jgi:hypothetical protein
MLKVVQFIDASRLNECFLVAAQPLQAEGAWEGRLLYFRFESIAPNSPRVPCVKDFGDHPTEQDLTEAVESWIRHQLFESWTKSELCEPCPC